MASLVLGGVVFRRFEIPESVRFPIRQRHHVHFLMGGKRVIDATGPDPLPIHWSGRFTGSNAASRCRTLEVMTAAGREVICVFGPFLRPVLITHFSPDMQKPYDIPYSIEVLPTRTEALGGGGSSPSMGRATGLDFAAALAGAATAAAIASGVA